MKSSEVETDAEGHDIAKATTIVTACMNREQNLLRVIDSWTKTRCHEIIIVDWSCDTPLSLSLRHNGIDEPRIKVIRVEDEERWILTHAYNVGLRACKTPYVLKLDNDHRISDSFFRDNYINEELDARLGSWRMARDPSQVYINGAFFARLEAIRNVGFFNEIITTYGWDDSYLHESLFSSGAKLGLLSAHSIEHIEQEHSTRTSNQRVTLEEELSASLGVKTTDFMNRRNMYLVSLLPRQGQEPPASSYRQVNRSEDENYTFTTLTRISTPTDSLDSSYTQVATVLAYRDFHCWAHGLCPASVSLSDASGFHSLLPTVNKTAHLPGEKPLQRQKLAKSRAQRNLPTLENHTIDKALMPKLKAILPTVCHYYGHTDNRNSYIVNISPLGLDKAAADHINGLLPDWIKEKVRCDSTDCHDLPSSSTRVVNPISAFGPLASHLLFQSTDENQYFWAAYNSLPCHLKRSLYDLIESGGKPCNIALFGIANGLASGLLTSEQAFIALNACRAISQHKSADKFRDWLAKIRPKLYDIHRHDAVDLMYGLSLDLEGGGNIPNPLTLSTSLYKGSAHVVEYCLNLKRMSLFDKTEVDIHLIPSSESEAQYEYINSFFRGNDNVRIYKHAEDPGLYNCWNITAKSASTTFVSNANADDRRSRYHSDYLVFISMSNGADAISSALLVDQHPTSYRYSSTQDVWFTGMGGRRTQNDLIQVAEDFVSSKNHMHCMPIWRKTLHERIGFFDEAEYGTSADWEFWIRAAVSGAHLHVSDLPLGFYLIDTGSHNRRKVDQRVAKERKIINKYFADTIGDMPLLTT